MGKAAHTLMKNDFCDPSACSVSILAFRDQKLAPCRKLPKLRVPGGSSATCNSQRLERPVITDRERTRQDIFVCEFSPLLCRLTLFAVVGDDLVLLHVHDEVVVASSRWNRMRVDMKSIRHVNALSSLVTS